MEELERCTRNMRGLRLEVRVRSAVRPAKTQVEPQREWLGHLGGCDQGGGGVMCMNLLDPSGMLGPFERSAP